MRKWKEYRQPEWSSVTMVTVKAAVRSLSLQPSRLPINSIPIGPVSGYDFSRAAKSLVFGSRRGLQSGRNTLRRLVQKPLRPPAEGRDSRL